ncbi:SGNH/GDSL hydrolase family protein [Streptomyces vinaceus]|uniref:hypothetical protein n=1 Tax=Streptomyces vinaceus TaxID=1960 RepID=UPI00381A0018
MRTTTSSRSRRLAASAIVLGGFLALAVPVAPAGAEPTAEAVKTVFLGDSYTANYGIFPINNRDNWRGRCFQATDNYPAVAARTLAGKGITVDVQADVSCSGARIDSYWNEQQLL